MTSNETDHDNSTEAYSPFSDQVWENICCQILVLVIFLKIAWENRHNNGLVTWVTLFINSLVAIARLGLTMGQRIMLSVVPIILIQRMYTILGKYYLVCLCLEALAAAMTVVSEIGAIEKNGTDGKMEPVCATIIGIDYVARVIEVGLVGVLCVQIVKLMRKLKPKDQLNTALKAVPLVLWVTVLLTLSCGEEMGWPTNILKVVWGLCLPIFFPPTPSRARRNTPSPGMG